LLTNYIKMLTKSCKKVANKFCCLNCDYETSRKSSFEKHNLSAKHNQLTSVNKSLTKSCEKVIEDCNFTCHICDKEYKSRVGLWKHFKACQFENVKTENNMKDEPTDKELIMLLLKQNSQLIEQNNELTKTGIHNNSHNTTNSHNKAFNLNFFLNETCKDAMNINDFVDSIKLQLCDLESVGKLGYVEGISNIIVKNLKALDIEKRPVHCTDKKRETMYIKDEDKWEKDEGKTKLHKIVRKVACKNQNLIPSFKEAHPDCNKYHSKFSDQYNKIIVESMGGPGDNDFEKEEKIIQKISQQVILEK